MSGWAQRDAERHEDEARELDDLRAEAEQLRQERDAALAEVERLRAEASVPPSSIDHTRAQVAALGAHGERVIATPADAPAGRFDHAVYGDGLALAYKIGAHGERVFRTG